MVLRVGVNALWLQHSRAKDNQRASLPQHTRSEDGCAGRLTRCGYSKRLASRSGPLTLVEVGQEIMLVGVSYPLSHETR
jgi:hypothetical protein